jgi:DNA-binding XRE family transcriptional regulator
MELFEYIFKKKTRGCVLAEKVGVTPNTIVNLKTRKTSCNLITALKLHKLSGGKISFEELLSKEAYLEYQQWLLKEINEDE